MTSDREKGYWDGFEAALDAVLEGQRLYGTTRKAVNALRIAARLGRELETSPYHQHAGEVGSDE